MTSATTAEAARPPLLLRGLLAGASVGAFTGLLDASRSLASSNELLRPRDALSVVLFYAVWFAPAGLLAAFAARRFAWPFRMLHLLVVVGAAWFLVVAWANVKHLPGFLDPLSISIDVVLLVVAAVLVVVRYRAPGEDLPHTRRWAILGLASAGIAAGIPFVVSERDAGAPPAATWDAASVPGGAVSPRRPNVLLYLVDTLRADHLSCWGYAKPTSPEVDAFAADATRFEDCRAATSWTKPSVASLITSMMPSSHACVEHLEVLVPEAETLAEVFRAAGWRTGGFTDNPFVTPEFGFGQGFEEFDETRPSVLTMGTLLGKGLFMTGIATVAGNPAGLGATDERGAAAIHRAFLGFVDGAKDAPWFAYVHAMEPHLPYAPDRADAEAMGFPAGEEYARPPRYTGMLPFTRAPDPEPSFKAKIVAQYDGEIRGWSRSFGALLAALRERGRLDDTVIVLVSDHGEEFHEHGAWTHGHSLHREVTQVPLVVRLPDALGPAAKASRGRVVKGTATLLDVMPTLLDVAGVRYPKGAEPSRVGRSLLPELVPAAGARVSDHLPSSRPILGEVTIHPMKLRSLREGRWMLLRAESPLETVRALYDDVSDPGHKRDRFEAQSAEAVNLEGAMNEFFRRLGAVALTRREREIDPETAAQLKRLGYTGGR